MKANLTKTQIRRLAKMYSAALVNAHAAVLLSMPTLSYEDAGKVEEEMEGIVSKLLGDLPLMHEAEAIDKAKLSIVEAQENPDSTMEQRGATFMNESLCRESLYMICKQYIDWYL